MAQAADRRAQLGQQVILHVRRAPVLLLQFHKRKAQPEHHRQLRGADAPIVVDLRSWAKTNMRTIASLICAIAIAGVLSSCSTTAVTPDKIASVDRSAKGFLLVSTDSGVEYYVRSAKDGYAGPSFINGLRPLWVLALEPGRYYIGDWYMAAGAQKRASGTQNYEFEVVAGEVTYIGHFVANFSTSKNLLGLNWIPHASPVVKDRGEIDVEEFKKAFPDLASLKIRFSVVDGFDWGAKSESTVPVPVILPR
jgi:hypothetical protein